MDPQGIGGFGVHQGVKYLGVEPLGKGAGSVAQQGSGCVSANNKSKKQLGESYRPVVIVEKEKTERYRKSTVYPHIFKE